MLPFTREHRKLSKNPPYGGFFDSLGTVYPFFTFPGSAAVHQTIRLRICYPVIRHWIAIYGVLFRDFRNGLPDPPVLLSGAEVELNCSLGVQDFHIHPVDGRGDVPAGDVC